MGRQTRFLLLQMRYYVFLFSSAFIGSQSNDNSCIYATAYLCYFLHRLMSRLTRANERAERGNATGAACFMAHRVAVIDPVYCAIKYSIPNAPNGTGFLLCVVVPFDHAEGCVARLVPCTFAAELEGFSRPRLSFHVHRKSYRAPLKPCRSAEGTRSP